MYYISEAISASFGKCKQTAESKQTADIIKIYRVPCSTTLDCMAEARSLQFLNFLRMDDDEKRLVGLRQARAAGNNVPEARGHTRFIKALHQIEQASEV